MAYFNKVRSIIQNYKRDVQGSFAIVWAVGITVAIAAIGAGIDIAGVSQAKSRALSITDQVALSASVFYSTHERLPVNDDEGYIDQKHYNTNHGEFSFPDHLIIPAGLRYKADYNIAEGEVRVVAWGRSPTAIMSMFGKDSIYFVTESKAKFADTDLKNPASIALVLDNSGSMAWDDTPSTNCVWARHSNGRWFRDCDIPDEAEPRIEGLKNSVNLFMNTLNSVVGPQNITGKRVLRTGMIPYDGEVIEDKEVDMEWGVISMADVNDMEPEGATNSALPIAQAWDWLNEENGVHASETGENNPLRYMIFMTDGQNSGTRTWNEKEGTGLWRGRECNSRWCWYVFEASEDEPTTPGRDRWEEGENPTVSDTQSKNSCIAMKAQGVRVFTIGFALEPGEYMANRTPNEVTATITPSVTSSAYSLLADCASAPTDFTTAENTNSLDQAFAQIGQSIIQDVVRLSQ